MNGATTTPLAITQYSYDDVDRLDCTAVRMNAATFGSLPGSACTHASAGSFGPDRITRSEYDLAGQLLKTIRAYGTPLQQDYATYTYTLNGQRETIADANSNLSTYEYDGFDRLARLRFPVLVSGAGTSSTTDYEEYGYDANGNLTSLRKRDGNVIGYVYDNLNREIVKDMPGGTAEDVFSGYDLLGRRLYARFGSDTGSGIDYSYDAPGRLLTESTFGRTLSYQYDAASNRTRITWPDSLYVQYTYDALNRMLQVRENGATSGQGLLASYGYDSLGRRSALSRGNGVSTAWAYDGMSRLTVLQQDAGGTTHDLTVTLAYSPASQLIARGADNDAYAWTGAIPGTTSYGAATGLNQYPSIDSDPYSYDANGNLTVGGGRIRAYDVENRLISVTGSPSLSLGYDPLGRLRETSTGVGSTEFLYSGDALVAEYNAMGSLTQRYVHGAGIDEPLVSYTGAGTTSRSWLLADERGSIIATTTAAGAATLYAYGPYGEPNNWTGPRFRYTGQIALPEAELYHYKARAYDPVLGRFLQTDPVGYEDGFNLYVYAGNDPVNLTDPTGNYGRGPGFTDEEWWRFNEAQKEAARQLRVTASAIDSALTSEEGSATVARAFERHFGEGTATKENMQQVSNIMQSMAGVLEDDGSRGYWAIGMTQEQFDQAGRSPGALAAAETPGSRVFINVEHGKFRNRSIMRHGIGHESAHSIGLSDARVGNTTAYRYGGPDQRRAYRRLPKVDSAAAMTNPDHIMGFRIR